MNVNDFMAKHGIADADLDRMAAPTRTAASNPSPKELCSAAPISMPLALAA